MGDKDKYIQSLDAFISQNPTIGNLNTADFRDFLIGLVGHESGYNSRAKQGSYYGWYQTNIPIGTSELDQHKKAFEHLGHLFKNVITKADIDRAKELGIEQAPLLLKYWNQENRVNNYLWNNTDSSDGLGTKISEYGNDLTMPLDTFKYAMDNIYGNYTIKQGDNWFNIQKRVRIPGRNYVTAGKDLWNMNKLNNVPFGSLKIGQTFNFGNAPEKAKTKLPEYLLGSWQKNLFDQIYPHSFIEKYRNDTTKYQYGGLVYKRFNPSAPKYKQEDLNYYDFDIFNSRFPVEPVVIYTPQQKEVSTKVEETPVVEETPTVEETTFAPLIQKGTVEYKSKDIDLGNMKELVELMRDEGISFRITSGSRPGSKTSNGSMSHHSSGNALDITPIQGQSWDDLIKQMRKSKRFISYMQEHKLGILDERSKKMQARTGATGAHFHIGPDLSAIANFNLMFRG